MKKIVMGVVVVAGLGYLYDQAKTFCAAQLQAASQSVSESPSAPEFASAKLAEATGIDIPPSYIPGVLLLSLAGAVVSYTFRKPISGATSYVVKGGWKGGRKGLVWTYKQAKAHKNYVACGTVAATLATAGFIYQDDLFQFAQLVADFVHEQWPTLTGGTVVAIAIGAAVLRSYVLEKGTNALIPGENSAPAETTAPAPISPEVLALQKMVEQLTTKLATPAPAVVDPIHEAAVKELLQTKALEIAENAKLALQMDLPNFTTAKERLATLKRQTPEAERTVDRLHTQVQQHLSDLRKAIKHLPEGTEWEFEKLLNRHPQSLTL